jgi:hypothetical protein
MLLNRAHLVLHSCQGLFGALCSRGHGIAGTSHEVLHSVHAAWLLAVIWVGRQLLCCSLDDLQASPTGNTRQVCWYRPYAVRVIVLKAWLLQLLISLLQLPDNGCNVAAAHALQVLHAFMQVQQKQGTKA